MPVIQRIAALACKDVANAVVEQKGFADLGVLSSLGSGGAFPGNMHADLTRKLAATRLSPPLRLEIPAKLGPGIVRACEQPVLAPHVLFSDLYHSYPEAWSSRVAPAADVMEKFWREMEGHPCLQAGGALKERPNYRCKAVPLKLHGDGVPITGTGKAWVKMMDVFSWIVVYRQQSSIG